MKHLISIMAFAALLPLPAGENILKNGTFETPDNEFRAYDKKQASQVEIVRSPGFFCGEKSLKLTKSAGESMGIISGDLPALPGKTIEVRFWAKADRPAPVCSILDFWRPNQNRHLYKKFLFKLETEWKEFSFTYMVPFDTTAYTALKDGKVKLRFDMVKSPEAVTVYLDSIEYRIK